DSIARLVRESHTPMLVGGLHVKWLTGGAYRGYNAAFFYDSTGAWRRWPVYEKHYLVPVVERVPFVPVSWFRRVPGLARWSGGFGRGRDLRRQRGGGSAGARVQCHRAGPGSDRRGDAAHQRRADAVRAARRLGGHAERDRDRWAGAGADLAPVAPGESLMRNAELGTRNILAEFEAACDC